jgi:signal transduction histidine kinase
MEITTEINLTDEQRAQMNLHSFLNILNILQGELQLIRLDLDMPEALPESTRLAKTILESVTEGRLDGRLAWELAAINVFFDREIHEARKICARVVDEPAVKESINNLNSILRVLTLRLEEHRERIRIGSAWLPHEVERLNDNFMGFLAAVEKNSRGRYHIIYNVAAQEASDYLVNLKIEGPGGSTLIMPPVMQDIFRDLIANARKYTAPGGEITAGLIQTNKELRLVVEDNGSGIPEKEIHKVVEFGYRAKKAREKETKGGGFGLTKAYVTTRDFGGQMWIESEVDRGTKVTIHVPLPGTG